MRKRMQDGKTIHHRQDYRDNFELYKGWNVNTDSTSPETAVLLPK